MPLFSTVLDAFVASREYDRATFSRLSFWSQQFGNMQLADITDDNVDAALVTPAERGRLKPTRGCKSIPSGKPLSPATVNRYIGQLGSIFKYAKKHRLLPRSFVPPTTGIEKEAERPDPERYLKPEEIDRILRRSRVLDRTYGKMTALITVAYHTGLRVGNLMEFTWADVDLDNRRIFIAKTKNGDPINVALSSEDEYGC